MISGALAVMVDRKEIKWTIYCVLWGWAQAEAGRMQCSSCSIITIYSNKLASCKYLLIYILIQVATNHFVFCGQWFRCWQHVVLLIHLRGRY